MNYSATINWLFQQFPSYQNEGANAYKPSLKNIELLCEAFGSPQNDLQFIHVAGTNGKGSTCAILSSIYQEANYKVGLFTSPHIKDFRERIRVNGEIADKAFIAKMCQVIREKQLDFSPSFFEITFLLALLYFKEQKADICIIETGLGGRLDATNIITPLLSLITNISIDHTQFLGNSIASIASEKAGIIKQHVPAIVSEPCVQSKPVFEEKVKEINSEVLFVNHSQVNIPLSFPLLGEFQKKNAGLALVAIQNLQKQFPVSKKSIQRGLENVPANTGFVGRLQILQEAPQIILDVAHNKDGIRKALEFVHHQLQGKLHIIYGTSADKDIASILPLFPPEAKLYLTEFSNARSASLQELKKHGKQFPIDVSYFNSPKNALEGVKKMAAKEDTILVIGSFFLIADLV